MDIKKYVIKNKVEFIKIINSTLLVWIIGLIIVYILRKFNL